MSAARRLLLWLALVLVSSAAWAGVPEASKGGMVHWLFREEVMDEVLKFLD